MCKGAMITTAVPPTNISRQPSTATKQRSKLRELSGLSRDLNPNVNGQIVVVICWKQKQASFRTQKKTNFLIHAKCPNQVVTQGW